MLTRIAERTVAMGRRLHRSDRKVALRPRRDANAIAAEDAQKAFEERIGPLQAAADAAAAHVGNLYVAFLSLGLYLTVTFGTTTHEQLLRGAPVELPIIGVEVGLFAFYWIGPALFVLFHGNLLMQVYLLSQKLQRLNGAIGELPPEAQAERRVRLHQLIFSHMLIGHHRERLIRTLLTLIAWSTFVVLPLAVLLLAQIRFLPYHDWWEPWWQPGTTWWHRLLVLADIVVIWLLWIRAIAPDNGFSRILSVSPRQNRGASQSRLIARRLRDPMTGRWDSLTRRRNPRDWLGWLVEACLAPFVGLGRRIRADGRRDGRLLRLKEITAIAMLIAFLIATIPGEYLARPLDAWIGPENSPPLIERNMVVRDTVLVDIWPTQAHIDQFGEDRAWQIFGKPINLHGRDLRYGVLSGSMLERANLRVANLQGAGLRLANLQNADLAGSNLQNADLRSAILREANLLRASAQGAVAERVDLRDACLDRADLQNANFYSANFEGSSLEFTILQGGDFSDADFQGAYLAATNLRGADLSGADFRGARLQSAIVQGARLLDADFRGATLRHSDLQGAQLESSILQGVDLRGARLWRAELPISESLWAYSDLRDVDIGPPRQDEIGSWTDEVERIAPDATRLQLLDILSRLERTLSQDWEPSFPPQWRTKTNVIFRESAFSRIGLAAPLPAEVFEKGLADFLIMLACTGETSLSRTEGIARRLLEDELDRQDRQHRALLAEALLAPNCAPAQSLPPELRFELEGLQKASTTR